MTLFHSDIERAGISPTLASMGKSKIPATGEGYLGEIMVHRLTRAVGVVDSVIEAKAGWPPQITLKLKDGSVKKGKLSDFREPTAAEREKHSPA
ncbi:MAG: hypothetical protein U1F83_09285 [Verrucomicrobiota bacterium]